VGTRVTAPLVQLMMSFQNDQLFIRALKTRYEWVRVLDLDSFSDLV
jgi:hypothetical protein